MDDLEDYFLDDITLDDSTLALLEQEEKYLTVQNNALPDAPPVSKKQKTISGWRPGPGNHFDNVDDDDNLPEISVQGDGTYGVRDAIRTSVPMNAVDVSFGFNAGATAATTIQYGPNFSTGINNIQQLLPVDGTRTGSMSTVPLQRPSHPSRQHPHTEPQLQKRLQEFSEENQRMQLALKEATDLKLTKEGEVTILRKGMEKTAQEHANQITRLKAEREAANAKQLQIQKEMKDEIERLKAQITFKQHEIESTFRRAPPSARASRINRDPLRTPGHRSSQAIGGTPLPSRLYLGQNQLVEEQRIETPKNRRFTKSPKGSYSGILPGFQNAFLTSPIALQQTNTTGQENPPPSSPMARSPPSSPTIRLVRNLNSPDVDAHADHFQHNSHAIIENDSDFMVADEEDNLQEEETIGQPINWTSELSRIILNHTLPNSALPTLQLLLATAVLAAKTDATRFAVACSEIFETLASSSRMDYTATARGLCHSLATMLFVIGSSEQHYNIQCLINLLSTLVNSLPEFGSYLLRANEDMELSLPAAVCEIVVRHLGHANKSDALANEILGLLETLCLRSHDDAISRLVPFVVNGKVWAAFLQFCQNESSLARTCQLLVLLGSYPSLARELVNISGVSSKEGDRSTEPGRLLLIDRLCTFLYEDNEGFNELRAIREHILIFFTMLSLSHPDSLAALTNNDVLIPSLICLLSKLTNLLWEEGEGLTATPQAVTSFIRMTSQVVNLIHYLVSKVEPSFNLKHRLHYNPHRALTGLDHMFIVSFGRLTFSEPPEWVDKY